MQNSSELHVYILTFAKTHHKYEWTHFTVHIKRKTIRGNFSTHVYFAYWFIRHNKWGGWFFTVKCVCVCAATVICRFLASTRSFILSKIGYSPFKVKQQVQFSQKKKTQNVFITFNWPAAVLQPSCVTHAPTVRYTYPYAAMGCNGTVLILFLYWTNNEEWLNVD